MPHTSSTRSNHNIVVTMLAAQPRVACPPSRTLFMWTYRAKKHGCTRRTTNILVTGRSFNLARWDPLDVSDIQAMVGILCITILLAMGRCQMHRTLSR
jgi:hypothetical protein